MECDLSRPLASAGAQNSHAWDLGMETRCDLSRPLASAGAQNSHAWDLGMETRCDLFRPLASAEKGKGKQMVSLCRWFASTVAHYTSFLALASTGDLCASQRRWRLSDSIVETR